MILLSFYYISTTAYSSIPNEPQNCHFKLDAPSVKQALIDLGMTCGVSVIIKGNLPFSPIVPVNYQGNSTVIDAIKAILHDVSYTSTMLDTNLIVIQLGHTSLVKKAISTNATIQNATSPLPNTDPQEIEVLYITGSRYKNTKLIYDKHHNSLISDALSQDEIGQYPDINVADTARRIPGLVNIRDEEEGISLGIRGLTPDLVLITLDNGTFASEPSLNIRRDFVEILPSTLFKSIQVLKTRSADIDGSALGGQINLITRSAFETDGVYTLLSAVTGDFTADKYDALNNTPAYQLNSLISSTFGSNQQFGFVFAASYFQRNQDEERNLSYYDEHFIMPTMSIWNGIEDQQKRYGGYAKIEFRSPKHFNSEISVWLFKQSEAFKRASLVLNSELASSDPNLLDTIDVNGSFEALISSDKKHHGGFLSKTSYNFNNNNTAQIRIGLSQGRATDGDAGRSDTTFDYIGAAGGLDYHYAFNENGMPPQYTYLNPELAENLDNYALSTVETDTVVNDGTVFDMETNLQHYFGGSGFDLKTGLRYRRTERSYDQNNIDIKYIGDSPLLLSQFATLSSQYRPPYAPINSPIIDNAAIIAYKMANPALFNDVTNQDNLLSSDFEIAEKVFASYASLGYQNDELQAHAGLRVEKTDLLTDAYARTNGILAPIQGKNDYTNLLPSAGLTYDLSQDIKIRANYAKALGRPNFPDLNPARTLTESAGITTIKEGNSKLDPRVADNVDLSFEYYFDEGRSLASVALFYKDIKDEIFTLQTQTTQNNAPVITTHPLNASDATLKGLELNLIKDRLDFLPGFLSDFGVSVNYTFIKADATVLATDGAARQVDFLTEQPRNLANAALFYQQGDFEGRLSYNLTGRYAASINPTNPDSDDFIDDFDTIDAQFRWQFNQNFTLMVEGRNLTNEKNVRLTGPNRSRNEDYSVFGKAYFVGVTYYY